MQIKVDVIKDLVEKHLLILKKQEGDEMIFKINCKTS
jgi:hypothetical protein